MTRARTVSDINAQLIDEHHFRLKMTTQAGTFVFKYLKKSLKIHLIKKRTNLD